MKIYQVGGAIRDKMLGLNVTERDFVVVGATPKDLLAQGFKPVGKDFPVFLHPKSHEEYALARTERKIAKGYKGFSFYAAPDVSLEQDLSRRDLTINAMAQAEDGTLIDPFSGRLDLKNKVLRHVSASFAEDPVRILRIARFYARFKSLGFTIAPQTYQLMRQMVRAGEVSALVAERVWQEFHKALLTAAPQAFICVLRQCGALAQIFVELDKLFGVPDMVGANSVLDVGMQSLRSLEKACLLSELPQVRFAALTLNLGKGLSNFNNWPLHDGFCDKGLAPLKSWCKRYRIPKAFFELARVAHRYQQQAFAADNATAQELVELLDSMDAFRRQERFLHLLQVLGAKAQAFDPKMLLSVQKLERVFSCVKKITAREIMQDGYAGAQIAKQLHLRRIDALKG